MSAYEFKLIKYADRLQEAGVPKEQALVHAQLLADVLQHLVTKEYLKEQLAEFGAALEARILVRMEAKLDGLRAEVLSALAQLEARIDVKHERLRTELLDAIQQLRVESAESRFKLVCWMFAGMFTQAAFIISCLKLL